jgi:hypothetical protein
MAPKKKTTKKAAPARMAPKAKVVESHVHEGDCCSSAGACATNCCEGWGTATRLWWSVTWRTFLWISLPVMLLQLAMASLANPAMPSSLLSFILMMVMNAPRVLAAAVMTAEFWFFIAVTLYTLLGAIFVYGHLIAKGKFFGVKLSVERDCK